MKAFVNRCIYWVAFTWWTYRTMWPHVSGRMFVFRDAPSWFIKEVILAAPSTREEMAKLDDDLVQYLREAIAEYRLRFPA